MQTSKSVQIIRKIVRGRIKITKMTSRDGSRVVIYADHLAAILVIAALLVAAFA